MTQLRTGLRWGLGVLVAVGLMGIPCVMRAQETRAEEGGEAPSTPEPRTFGTSSATIYRIAAAGFGPSQSTTTYTHGSQPFTRSRVTSVGDGLFGAPVTLPAGARVTRLELEACDFDDTDLVSASLWVCAQSVGACSEHGTVSTGSVPMPGCRRFGGGLDVTIDNLNNSYPLRVNVTGATQLLSFRSVALHYVLQVSPAPAVATFSDVPTSHPFFQFVEALARSGITSGCGNGNFCPDAPLTRGQMAVFLSLGLGLHFAP